MGMYFLVWEIVSSPVEAPLLNLVITKNLHVLANNMRNCSIRRDG